MSDPFVGEIRMFGFSRTPVGWFACDGSLRSIAQYEVLYTLLGTTYGGDGVNTFALPNLSGRAPVHQGTGPNLTTRIMGQIGGSETVGLTLNQLPAHTHGVVASPGSANATAISPTVLLGTVSGDTMYAMDTTGASAFAMSNATTSSQGNGVAHDNSMPTLTVQFCIAYNGIFPSQG